MSLNKEHFPRGALDAVPLFGGGDFDVLMQARLGQLASGAENKSCRSSQRNWDDIMC